jgi:hypothetical protein
LKWEVSGRNQEKEIWQRLDSRNNEFIKEDAKENNYVAITFSCQTKGKFQQFKFEMIDKAAYGGYTFNLDSLELFGTLFEFEEIQ